MAMSAQTVLDRFGHLPYISAVHSRKMEAFIKEHKFVNCLELGFYHGKSSAVIASTLKELGRGHLTTIDREEARGLQPNIETLIQDLGLGSWITHYYEPRSYTWRLMKMIEANPEPVYDFCYIDGGHSWDVTGLGFLLVDRLLRPGGWVLFDDLHWTYASMVKGATGLPAWLRRMPEEERNTPQVRKVWELLVKRHPNYQDFREDGQWAFARKNATADASGARPEANG